VVGHRGGVPTQSRGAVCVVGLLVALAAIVAACGSATPASGPHTAATAITSAWTTFFDGATTVDEKAAVLEQGASATADIGTFFSLYPKDLTTKVDSVQLNGSTATATVTYEFFAGTRRLSARPAAGIAVLIDGRWMVSQQTWNAWVAVSDIHGSG